MSVQEEESVHRRHRPYDNAQRLGPASQGSPVRRVGDTEAPAPTPIRVQQPSRRWTRPYLAALLGADMVVVTVSLLAAHALVGAELPLPAVLVGIAVWPVTVALLGGYVASHIAVGSSELAAVAKASVLLVVIAALAGSLWSLPQVVTVSVVALPGLIGLGLVVRFVSRKVIHHQQVRGRLLRGVLAVGSVTAVRHLSTVLQRDLHCGLDVVGVCVPADQVRRAVEVGLPVIADTDHVTEAVSRTRCEAVAVTASQSPEFLRRLSWSLEDSNVALLVNPGVVEVAGPRLHLHPHIGLPLVHVERPHFTGWRRVVKRGTDIVLTALGLCALAPVMLAIALAIKLSSPGPVLFRQTRVGLGGRTFTMYKFRSMVVDAEARLAELAARNEGAGILFKMAADPRITRVGGFLRRYSLDELPQLFNILAGSMSLVGPRPPLPSEVAQYSDEVHRRLLVKPGLTGLWQVSGRSLLSWEESVRLDLRYVENWCLSMDFLLLWKTLGAVVAKRGAF